MSIFLGRQFGAFPSGDTHFFFSECIASQEMQVIIIFQRCCLWQVDHDDSSHPNAGESATLDDSHFAFRRFDSFSDGALFITRVSVEHAVEWGRHHFLWSYVSLPDVFGLDTLSRTSLPGQAPLMGSSLAQSASTSNSLRVGMIMIFMPGRMKPLSIFSMAILFATAWERFFSRCVYQTNNNNYYYLVKERTGILSLKLQYRNSVKNVNARRIG
jgi:hypothetical protein